MQSNRIPSQRRSTVEFIIAQNVYPDQYMSFLDWNGDRGRTIDRVKDKRDDDTGI
jgi:antibiotic biosynthesis monooxygenase (ABM) superfamily enzyme